jgi:hypothetical protein
MSADMEGEGDARKENRGTRYEGADSLSIPNISWIPSLSHCTFFPLPYAPRTNYRRECCTCIRGTIAAAAIHMQLVLADTYAVYQTPKPVSSFPDC